MRLSCQVVSSILFNLFHFLPMDISKPGFACPGFFGAFLSDLADYQAVQMLILLCFSLETFELYSVTARITDKSMQCEMGNMIPWVIFNNPSSASPPKLQALISQVQPRLNLADQDSTKQNFNSASDFKQAKRRSCNSTHPLHFLIFMT